MLMLPSVAEKSNSDSPAGTLSSLLIGYSGGRRGIGSCAAESLLHLVTQMAAYNAHYNEL
jgi:hypothetical protein